MDINFPLVEVVREHKNDNNCKKVIRAVKAFVKIFKSAKHVCVIVVVLGLLYIKLLCESHVRDKFDRNVSMINLVLPNNQVRNWNY